MASEHIFQSSIHFVTTVPPTIVICPWNSFIGGLEVRRGATDGWFQAAGLRYNWLQASPAPRSRSGLAGTLVSSSSVKLLQSRSLSSSVSSKRIPPKPYSCAWTDTSFGIKWGDPSTKSANLLERRFNISNRDNNHTMKISSLWVP